MNTNKNKILLFIDWFTPGYKAGGPIQSCENMIAYLSDKFEFWIVTRNTDYNEDVPYSNVVTNKWVNYTNGKNKVYYISKDKLNKATIHQIISTTTFNFLYLNGVFSVYFTLLPLYLAKRMPHANFKIIIAARGMLSPSTLNIKRRKKKVFVKLTKIFGIFNRVVFHATSKQELLDIKKIYGEKVRIGLASNLPKKMEKINTLKDVVKPDPNIELKLIYLARIAPEKNLKFALSVLHFLDNCNITFDIYGPIYNQHFWNECKDLMLNMPAGVKVNYQGSIENNKISRLYKNYHFLFIPTLSENFGHSIFEALSNGLPVIISDQTPWLNLEMNKAGWSINLNQSGKFVEVIKYCSTMSKEEYNELSISTLMYLSKKINIADIIEEYHNLFEMNKPALNETKIQAVLHV